MTDKQTNLLSIDDMRATSKSFSSPLPTSVLNIEDKHRSNLFPWRGQFSPQLVESLLKTYAAPNAAVLDSFMGSGTVLIESARLSHPAYGYEVNPAAYLLARVYELCVLNANQRRLLLDEAEQILNISNLVPINLSSFHEVKQVSAQSINYSHLLHATYNPRIRMLLEALIVLMDDNTNHDNTLAIKWSTIRSIVNALPFTQEPVIASLGDARSLDLPDGVIDFVLSSPPYINVFNYHHNSRQAVQTLGWKPLIVARSEIGSNRKFRQNRFLTVIQYCIDMALAMNEIRRVCTSNARILLILGRESNVHKTAFFNSHILERIAVDLLGFHLELKQERVFTNRFGLNIYEDLLHFISLPAHAFSVELIVEQSKSLGKDFLRDAITRVPSDRLHYLNDAISRTDQVEASPIFQLSSALGVAI